MMNDKSKQSGFASATEVARSGRVTIGSIAYLYPRSSVSAETRRKVLAAAEVLNYHVNHLARGLSKRPAARCIGGNGVAVSVQPAGAPDSPPEQADAR
jgi:DNA-binding LacI/PurR family transcriptional regulator